MNIVLNAIHLRMMFRMVQSYTIRGQYVDHRLQVPRSHRMDAPPNKVYMHA